MSEQQNRVAALLNNGSTTTSTEPVGTVTAPGTVAYDVKPGQDATSAQLGIDTTPDALITVDGHQVASGDNGLSVDIAPDGSTHVVHGPQTVTSGTQLTNGQPVTGTQPVTLQPVNGAAPTGGNITQTGMNQNGTGAPLGGTITQTGMTQDGTGAPLGGNITQTGMTLDPTQTGGVQDPTQTGVVTPPPDTPIEHLHGTGDHAAQVDLALFGPGAHTGAPVVKQNDDGSQDITIPAGPDNPHAITLHVKPNADGSLDITAPKSDTNPHEIKIHVQPDKHLDLNVTQDKDGHLKIDAHDHTTDQKDDWPGLKQPAGNPPPLGTGDPVGPPATTVPGGTGAGGAGDPTSGIPTPQIPNVPSGGGGGAIPKGGGGGAVPVNTGQLPVVTGPQVSGQTSNYTGYASITQDSINALGQKIQSGPVQTMSTAHKATEDLKPGYWAFGPVGSMTGLQSMASETGQSTANQFAEGQSKLAQWTPNLVQTWNTWQTHDNDSTAAVNGITNPGGTK